MDVQTILEKAKRLAQESGLTYQEIGVRMGYPKGSARQVAWKFLHSKNPSVAMLLRFAKALEINVKELL